MIAVASGKGGVGKSTLTANLAAALSAARPPGRILDADIYGHSIPHMLGIQPEAGARRQADDPAGRARHEADVDRLLPRRQRAADVARADAAPRARAVPAGRALGRARRARRRHAARHRRRLDLARPAAAARRGGRRDDAAGAGAGGREPRRRDGAEDRDAAARRGREHDLRGVRLGRRRAARRRARREAARLGAARRAAARVGRRGHAARARRIPTREPARAIVEIARALDASAARGFTRTLPLVS